jgi:hypothetical protein
MWFLCTFLKSKKLNRGVQFENICWCKLATRFMPSVPEFWPKMIYIFFVSNYSKVMVVLPIFSLEE